MCNALRSTVLEHHDSYTSIHIVRLNATKFTDETLLKGKIL